MTYPRSHSTLLARIQRPKIIKHFAGKDIKTQRCEGTYPRSHSKGQDSNSSLKWHICKIHFEISPGGGVNESADEAGRAMGLIMAVAVSAEHSYSSVRS